jgi:hypothetical protein
MAQRIDVPGMGVVEFPDGMTDDQIVSAIKANSPAQADPMASVKTPAQRRQDLGNEVAGLFRGLGSIGATLLAPGDAYKDRIARLTGQPAPMKNDQRREGMDRGLQEMGAQPDSGRYKGGKIGGEVLGTLGVGPAVAGLARLAPGAAAAAPYLSAVETGGASAAGMAGTRGMLARTAGGATTGAASAGLVNPEDAGAGAVIGAGMPGAAKIAGWAGGQVGGAARSMLGPNINNPPLADKALNQYGIPLGLADVSASNATKALRSVLNDAPITGGIGSRQAEGVQQGFNAAVGDTFGAKAPSLTPAVLDAAKKRMGSEFDRIWNSNALQVDGAFMQKLSDLQNAAAKLPRSEGGSLDAEITDLLSKVTPDAQGNLIVPGDVANKFQSYLRRRAEGSAGLRNELNDLRQAVISAFNRGVSPADAAALTMNRGQYKAFKTVEPLLTGAEAGVAGRQVGDVPASLLPQAVRKSYGSNIAGSPFEDLTQIGSQYIADRVGRTGGSTRAMIQNSALGSALTLGATASPMAALSAIPAAAGVQGLLGSPRVARAAVAAAQSPSGLLSLDPEIQRLLFRSAPGLLAGQ